MEHLPLLRRWLPASEIIRLQKRLGISPQQVWFIMACSALENPNDTMLSEYTGVPRTSIRDIRKSLIDSGLMDEEWGLEGLFEAIVTGQGDSINPGNESFDSLTPHEKLMVLDQFECRVCHVKWRPDGPVRFRVGRLTKGEMLSTRVVVCEKCIGHLKDPDVLVRMGHYLRGREERLKDRQMTCLSNLEQENIATIRARAQDPSLGKMPSCSATPSNITGFVTELVITNGKLVKTSKPPLTIPPSLFTQIPSLSNKKNNIRAIDSLCGLVVPRESAGASARMRARGPRPSLEKLQTETQDQESQTGTAKSGQNGDGAAKYAVEEYLRVPSEKRRGGIRPEDEDQDDGLIKSDKPIAVERKLKDVRMAKRREESKRRYAERIEFLSGCNEESEWKGGDYAKWFGHEFHRKHGYFYDGENIAERNKHANLIAETVENLDEYKRFVAWVMDKWYDFWWSDETTKPTSRNVASRLGELLAVFRDGGAYESLKSKAEGVGREAKVVNPFKSVAPREASAPAGPRKSLTSLFEEGRESDREIQDKEHEVDPKAEIGDKAADDAVQLGGGVPSAGEHAAG